LEILKSGLFEDAQIHLKIAETRLPAYQAFWRTMRSVSPTDPQLGGDPAKRKQLSDALRKCFFEEGHGILLSHSALTRYRAAIDALQKPVSEIPDPDIVKLFSDLRTQMKLDLWIYTEEEAKKPTDSSTTAGATKSISSAL
jgi:hypothetical protein